MIGTGLTPETRGFPGVSSAAVPLAPRSAHHRAALARRSGGEPDRRAGAVPHLAPAREWNLSKPHFFAEVDRAGAARAAIPGPRKLRDAR